MNYHNKRFRVMSNSDSGETDSTTIFHYHQSGNVLWSDYSGGDIVRGHLIGIVDDHGHIDMRYHQINTKGQLRTGQCHSTPERLPDGRIMLHETWQWTSEDRSTGTSVLVEMQ